VERLLGVLGADVEELADDFEPGAGDDADDLEGVLDAFVAAGEGVSDAESLGDLELACDDDGAALFEPSAGGDGVALDPRELGHGEEAFGLEGDEGCVVLLECADAEGVGLDGVDGDGACGLDEGEAFEGVLGLGGDAEAADEGVGELELADPVSEECAALGPEGDHEGQAGHHGAGGEAVAEGGGGDGALDQAPGHSEGAHDAGPEQSGDQGHDGDGEEEVSEEDRGQADGGVCPEHGLGVGGDEEGEQVHADADRGHERGGGEGAASGRGGPGGHGAEWAGAGGSPGGPGGAEEAGEEAAGWGEDQAEGADQGAVGDVLAECGDEGEGDAQAEGDAEGCAGQADAGPDEELGAGELGACGADAPEHGQLALLLGGVDGEAGEDDEGGGEEGEDGGEYEAELAGGEVFLDVGGDARGGLEDEAFGDFGAAGGGEGFGIDALVQRGFDLGESVAAAEGLAEGPERGVGLGAAAEGWLADDADDGEAGGRPEEAADGECVADSEADVGVEAPGLGGVGVLGEVWAWSWVDGVGDAYAVAAGGATLALVFPGESFGDESVDDDLSGCLGEPAGDQFERSESAVGFGVDAVDDGGDFEAEWGDGPVAVASGGGEGPGVEFESEGFLAEW
jgi:hypothetical protein